MPSGSSKSAQNQDVQVSPQTKRSSFTQLSVVSLGPLGFFFLNLSSRREKTADQTLLSPASSLVPTAEHFLTTASFLKLRRVLGALTHSKRAGMLSMIQR